jgi:hypothetical protein
MSLHSAILQLSTGTNLYLQYQFSLLKYIYVYYESGFLSLGVKQPRLEADHSPPSSAEIKERVELHLHSPIRPHDAVLS